MFTSQRRRASTHRSIPVLALVAVVVLALNPTSAWAAPPRAATTATAPTASASAASASTAAPATSSTPATTATADPRVSGIHSAAPEPATSAPAASSSAGSGPAASASPATSSASLSIAQAQCVPDTSTAAGLQAAFNIRGPVWGGGDGAQPIQIDGGRTLWLFGDTYIGGGPYGGPLTTTGLVHNSMVVQYDNTCFADLLGGGPGGWSEAIPDPASGDWYWPQDGTYDPSTGILSIAATHVRNNGGGLFGWTVLGVDVLHYQVEPTLQLLDAENLVTFSGTDLGQFGQSITVSGGIAYLYGCAQTGTPACYLARTDLRLDPATLQFQTAGGGWSSSMSAAAPLSIGGMTGTELHVRPVSDGWLATNQVPLLGTATNVWWSTSPAGPFTSGGTLFDENLPPLGPLPSNWFTYGGRTIQTSAGEIGVYSVNTTDSEGATVAGVYGPRFVALDSNQLDRTPFGGVNLPPTAQSGGAEIRGWTIDPDTAASIKVTLSVDGTPTITVTASVNRPDVAALYPAYGSAHGFDTVVPLGPGVHQVCAFGVNVINGVGNTLLGCTEATAVTTPGWFVPVTPTRILDSRAGTGGYTTPWVSGQARSLAVAGVGVVPSGATSVVLNLTVTDTTGPGFVTVAPAGGIVPTASNVNFVAGQTVANQVTVPVGVGGQLLLYVGGAQADLVADVVGYTSPAAASGYTPVAPARLLDSRTGTGGYSTPWGPHQTRTLAVAGHGGVPAQASAVVLNLTATDTTAYSYVSAWPGATPWPGTSNLNVAPGQTLANLVTVPIGADGTIDLSNYAGSLDLVADLVGYYQPGTGTSLVGLGPVRLLDSRNGTGGPTTPWGTGQTRTVGLAGEAGIPGNATAVVLNLTATDTTAYGFVTAWPAGARRGRAPRPSTSPQARRWPTWSPWPWDRAAPSSSTTRTASPTWWPTWSATTPPPPDSCRTPGEICALHHHIGGQMHRFRQGDGGAVFRRIGSTS